MYEAMQTAFELITGVTSALVDAPKMSVDQSLSTMTAMTDAARDLGTIQEVVGNVAHAAHGMVAGMTPDEARSFLLGDDEVMGRVDPAATIAQVGSLTGDHDAWSPDFAKGLAQVIAFDPTTADQTGTSDVAREADALLTGLAQGAQALSTTFQKASAFADHQQAQVSASYHAIENLLGGTSFVTSPTTAGTLTLGLVADLSTH